jgi:hypothetical protein
MLCTALLPVKADTTASGSPDIGDALEILRYLAKLPSDYDGSGISPTISDALCVLKVLAKVEVSEDWVFVRPRPAVTETVGNGSSGSPSPTTTSSATTTSSSVTTTSPDTTETATTTTVTDPPRLLGDVDGNGVVTINDALEILRYLAKLPSEVTASTAAFDAACILRDPHTDYDVPYKPTINDALEILKKLAKLANRIDGYEYPL